MGKLLNRLSPIQRWLAVEIAGFLLLAVGTVALWGVISGFYGVPKSILAGTAVFVDLMAVYLWNRGARMRAALDRELNP